MNFIIDPLTNTKYDLQSLEAKQLIKSYIKLYQNGGSGGAPASISTTVGNTKDTSIDVSAGVYGSAIYGRGLLMYYLPSRCLPMFQMKVKKHGGFDTLKMKSTAVL